MKMYRNIVAKGKKEVPKSWWKVDLRVVENNRLKV